MGTFIEIYNQPNIGIVILKSYYFKSIKKLLNTFPGSRIIRISAEPGTHTWNSFFKKSLVHAQKNGKSAPAQEK